MDSLFLAVVPLLLLFGTLFQCNKKTNAVPVVKPDVLQLSPLTTTTTKTPVKKTDMSNKKESAAKSKSVSNEDPLVNTARQKEELPSKADITEDNSSTFWNFKDPKKVEQNAIIEQAILDGDILPENDFETVDTVESDWLTPNKTPEDE